MAKKKPAQNSIMKYVMKGPAEIEKRLLQLDAEMRSARTRLLNLASFRMRLKKRGWNIATPVTQVVKFSGYLGRRTIREIKAEKKALSNFIGGQLRAWEIKPSGPAPLV